LKLAGEDGPPDGARLPRVALLCVWAAIVLVMAVRHVFWRDEVRAFNLALQGDTVVDMLRGLRGEGHPALWYLLLRGAHMVAPIREVLPIVSVAVAAAAMALVALRSPFHLLVIGLILFSGFGLFEYSVVARNYGISMLVLFALAHLYPRHRDKGPVVGILLALLCNTNVPSALLAACFLLYWLIDLLGEEGLRWGRKYKLLLLNGAIAAAGAVICFLTVFPTVHDAAQAGVTGSLTPAGIAAALFSPTEAFWQLLPYGTPAYPAIRTGLGILLAGSLIGLATRPGALVSSLLALAGFELFFHLVYPGGYRHQALILIYLITMYWLAARGHGGRWPSRWRADAQIGRAATAGRWAFIVLLAIQVWKSEDPISRELQGRPHSRARDLGRLLAEQRLQHAVLIADPDVHLEPMPYYSSNPIYLMREQRFGAIPLFTRRARVELSLDDYLADARALRQRTGRPVVIVMMHRLDPAKPPFRLREVYAWYFSADPAQVRRFQAATRRIASFPPAVTDESYDVYLLPAAGR
jgi:hypothetical protein